MTKVEFYDALRRTSADGFEWALGQSPGGRPALLATRGDRWFGPVEAVAALLGMEAGRTWRVVRDFVGLSPRDGDVVAWAARGLMLGHPVVWRARAALFEAAGVAFAEEAPPQQLVCQWCIDADMVGVGLVDCVGCGQPVCQDHGGPGGWCPTCRPIGRSS